VTREVTEMRGHTKHSRRFGAAWSLVLPALLVLVAGPGCELPDPLTLPKNAPSNHPWKLNFGPRAVNMAVGEVVQLTFDPRTIDGTPIPLSELPPITYTTTNPDVKVDANGRLTSTRALSSVNITATMLSPDSTWKLFEQIRVRIEDAPYAVPSFKMELSRPSPVPANRGPSYSAFVETAPGDTVWPLTSYETDAPPTIYYMSIPSWGAGSIRGLGHVKVVGTSYIFGTLYRDSVDFEILYPDSTSLTIWRGTTYMDPSPSFMARTDQTILKGGKVTFINSNPTLPCSVVFDDEANVVGGNIPVVPASPGKAVTFPNTGKFTYKTSFGATGTITVVDWPAQP